ncbi:MAG: hypothetical protein KGO96_07480 [Elusimicrobia bacterium]|nr:hypothetical protein [Elusimicrobiota bacterium]
MFYRYYGPRYVGRFGAGRREVDKPITVGIAKSLTNVKDEKIHAYKHLIKCKVLIVDESHTVPTETLLSVCNGICKNVPYRYFVSGTQTRNDGSELLLKGLIGPIVGKLTVQDLVDKSFISKPIFKMFNIISESAYSSAEALAMIRKHYLYNEKVYEKAAFLANKFVGEMGFPVLILLDELEQYKLISPLLKFDHKFAFGGNVDGFEGIKKENPTKLVEQFNNLEYPILIGTDCISMGTNVLPVQAVILIKGGKSEIRFRQAVGRGLRKVPGKDFCYIIDFNIENIPMLNRHAMERKRIYESIYPPVNIIND